MKVDFKRVAIWSAVGIVSAITIWQVVKAIRTAAENRRNEQDEANNQNTGSSAGTPAPAPAPAKFDYSKVLRPGSPVSQELTAAKKIFNKVIESAKRMAPIPNSTYDPSGFTNQKELRRKAVADLELLDTATKYGTGTEKVAKTLLGNTSFTYTRVKQFHIDWNKTYGLPAPYKN